MFDKCVVALTYDCRILNNHSVRWSTYICIYINVMSCFVFNSGFDDQGRQFDLEGNLVDWWQDDTEAKFSEKAQCMVDQVLQNMKLR